MRTTTICLSLLLSSLALAADHPEIPLWANGAPGSEGKTAKEIDEAPNKDHGYLKVTGVHNPSITAFLPPRETATGAAMVIAPGGGHQFLNFDQEGTYVAAYLNSIGVAGFVLKYRLAREPDSTYKIEEHALADAQRAIRLIRSRAEEWRVNPARVGIMGFSAGGEVAVSWPADLVTAPGLSSDDALRRLRLAAAWTGPARPDCYLAGNGSTSATVRLTGATGWADLTAEIADADGVLTRLTIALGS